MKMCRFIGLVVLVVAFVATRQGGAAPTMAERATEYAAQNNLPIRQVPIQVAGRQGVRIFVPVTEASHDAFVKAFTEGGAILRQQAADAEHVSMALTPKDVIHNWGAPGEVFPPSAGGRYIALNLSQEEKAHFKATLPEAQGEMLVGKNESTHCTQWLLNGKVGVDRPLSHQFGVKRSRAPSNLVKKLIHAGNDGVVVGVAMSQHAAGTEDARRQLSATELALSNLETRIAELEAEDGGGARGLQAQAASFEEAIAKLDRTIAERASQQPSIAAGLRIKKEEMKKALAILTTSQHEASYPRRTSENEAEIQRLRAVANHNKASIALLHSQLAQARAGEKGRDDLAREFAAIPDHVLLGPPPGAGGGEAVH